MLLPAPAGRGEIERLGGMTCRFSCATRCRSGGSSTSTTNGALVFDLIVETKLQRVRGVTAIVTVRTSGQLENPENRQPADRRSAMSAVGSSPPRCARLVECVRAQCVFSVL